MHMNRQKDSEEDWTKKKITTTTANKSNGDKNKHEHFLRICEDGYGISNTITRCLAGWKEKKEDSILIMFCFSFLFLF